MCFAPETNTLVLETNVLKMSNRTSATHTASYKQLPNRPYVKVIATHRCLTSINRRCHALVLTYEYATSTNYIYAIVFSAGLNGVEVDQVHRENDLKTSTFTQLLVPSKLITASNTCVQLSRCHLTIHVTPTQLLHEKPRSEWTRTRNVFETVLRP